MELDRIRKDVNYAHFRMYLSYVVLGLIILISAFYCALTLFEMGQQENLRQWGKTSNFYLLVPLVYFALYRMAVDMRLMRNAYKDDFAIEKLESHIEALSKRLQPNLSTQGQKQSLALIFHPQLGATRTPAGPS